MGYTTTYTGTLFFKKEPTVEILRELKRLEHADARAKENRHWLADFPQADEVRYIAFRITDNLDGIEWNEDEKFNEAIEAVNLITHRLRKIDPSFAFEGSLNAQGEDFDDRWVLEIDDQGWAVKRELKLIGDVVRCPHCDNKFMLTDEMKVK